MFRVKIIFSVLLLLVISFSVIAEYDEIPAQFISHPELGKTVPPSQINPLDYELIHLRTKNSRTYLNKNRTKTKVYSSAPLHYPDEKGFYLSLDYSFTKNTNNHYIMPQVNPIHGFHSNTGTVEFMATGNAIVRISNINMLFTDEEGNVLHSFSPTTENRQYNVDGNFIVRPKALDLVDVEHQFFDYIQSTDYIFNSVEDFPLNTNTVTIENLIEVPEGYTLFLDDEQNILIWKIGNEDTLRIQPAILIDSSPRNVKSNTPKEYKLADYQLLQVASTQYAWRLKVDARWLQAEDLNYPVRLKSVISIENHELMNSCFYPQYQQNTLQVEIPEGETILWTDISYDFVALSNTDAWISDQLSFVSAIGGQTSLLTENINMPGMHTYNINNSHIANGISTGLVPITFHAGRTWGGSGCNANYNFINRRWVQIHYGTIEFGDGPVLINEYSASNRTHTDGFGRTEDWIELYNANPDYYFDLTGYYLSNDPDEPQMWQIPQGMIPPGSKVLVYASKRDMASGTVLHANFNLTQLRPDAIVFSNPQGEILESILLEKTQIHHSRGRITDGADQWGIFTNPSPWQANSNAKQDYASTPVFSMLAGHYSEPLTVSISSLKSNEIIRFTTDGSTPSATSQVFAQPIEITQTTVLRARTFSENPEILPGFIETTTFFIDENHSLPIFSFAGDADLMQLFNGNESLRPLGSFEFFNEEGEFQDKNFGDFNKHGNDSWNYNQRGVDFISRDDYGYQRRLEYPFFATSHRTRFRRLMVKAAANDNYPFEHGGAHIRDSYIQTLSQLAGLDLDERSSTNVIVYLNGQYWGVYDLRERVDDNNFTDFYYGQDYRYRESDEHLQFIKTWGATYAHFGNQSALNDWTSIRNFVQSNDMGESYNYEYVASQINIQSLIDYFVLNSYVVSRDWLNYNTGWWRGLNPNGQAREWRYYVWDMEAAFGHFHDYTGLPQGGPTAPPCQAENLNVGDGHTQILRKLIAENPQVREKYILRYVDLLNTHFKYENAIHVLDSLIDNMAPEMPRQIQRWGGNMQTWQNNVQNIRDYLWDRTQYFPQGMIDCYDLNGPFTAQFEVYPQDAGSLQMNSVNVTNFPFTATLYGNISTSLKALSHPAYVFSHWETHGLDVDFDPNQTDIRFDISSNLSITAHFTPALDAEHELVHYWHFNSLSGEPLDEVYSDYSANTMTAKITYPGTGAGYMDARTHRDSDPVSDINLRMGQMPAQGAVLRFRNPANTRQLLFNVPSNGYEDLVVQFATTRTKNGAEKQRFEYSVDGGNQWNTILAENEVPLLGNPQENGGEDIYAYVKIDFTGILEVNDNENLMFKIVSIGEGSDNISGNQRIDNFSVDGIALEKEVTQTDFLVQKGVKMFPNPADAEVHFYLPAKDAALQVFNLSGQMVYQVANLHTNYLLNVSEFNKGLYIVQIYYSEKHIPQRLKLLIN